MATASKNIKSTPWPHWDWEATQISDKTMLQVNKSINSVAEMEQNQVILKINKNCSSQYI